MLEDVTLMRVHGDITIDAEGRVTSVDIDKRVPADIAANVVRVGNGWRFHPVLVDGRPTAAKAHLRLVLSAPIASATATKRGWTASVSPGWMSWRQTMALRRGAQARHRTRQGC
jgi:hypothetical protein